MVFAADPSFSRLARQRDSSMANALAPQKTMTLGEGGLALAMAALALLSIVVAAKAYTAEFAFHAYLFTAASVAAVFAIVNRYYERPAEHPPLTIDGKPNYNMGPVKFATVAAMFWGIAGFTVGLYIASELAFPILNLDLPWTTFGRLRPLHTSAVIFAFGGNVLIGTSFYVVQPHCRAHEPPRAARRRPGALVRRARLQFLHSHCRHRLSARHHPVERICRAGMVRRSLADHRVGDLFPGLPRHHHSPHRAAYLRRQLVLSRLHSDHRGAASRQ